MQGIGQWHKKAIQIAIAAKTVSFCSPKKILIVRYQIQLTANKNMLLWNQTRCEAERKAILQNLTGFIAYLLRVRLAKILWC